MGFSKKNISPKKYRFFVVKSGFWWFFRYHANFWKNRKIKKKSCKFFDFDKKLNFADLIALVHLVSENMSSGGHFGTFTTHRTHLFIYLGSVEDVVQNVAYLGLSSSVQVRCSKSFREKLKSFENNLFLPFCSKFNVVYGKILYFAIQISIHHFIAFWKFALDFSRFFSTRHRRWVFFGFLKLLTNSSLDRRQELLYRPEHVCFV